MEGVGELFGRSVDAVLHRPRAVLVPLFVDLGYLLVGTALFALVAHVELLFPQGYRLPSFPVAVPHALPTVGDVMGPTPAISGVSRPAILAALMLILLSIPLLAYAEAGFLGVLRAVYLTEHDVLEEGRHPDAWSRVRESFAAAGRKHWRTFLALRAIQALLAIAALLLPLLLPRFGNYGLGVLAVDVLLLYAPYAAIESGKGIRSSIRESVQLVSDHLATTLVALLFGFLLTGGVGLLAGPMIGLAGIQYGPFVMSLVYAPVGTALALFLYNVYLSFQPRDLAPESAPAGATVPAGA
jgi:hypothetical protein